MKGDHKFRKKPKGATGGGYARPRVQIGFDKPLIAAISKRAKSNKHSFAAEVRQLVSTALCIHLAVDNSLTSPDTMGFPE